MNPPNPFGSPQGGAFQVTNSTMKTGLFQPFGQQMPSNQPQAMGFFSSSAFGQPAASNQPRPNAVFGQGTSFGQPSKPPSSLPSQTPAFGQPAAGMGFSSSSTPAFGQPSGSNQAPMFGQTPAFGQPSAFGQTPGFGKPPPAYGEQPSGFGISQVASGAATSLGQPQPLGFGQPVFGQPSSTSGTTNVFATQTQSKGFGTEFSFKPPNDRVFKPIFSASPEPGNPQTISMSSSPFGGSETQTKSSTTSNSGPTGFSALTGDKSGQLGFRFSQPAAAPSISAQNNPLTTGKNSSPTNLQFTFSQPAAPSSTNTNVSITQPTTPSSFSFSAKALQPQSVSLFGGANTGQPSAFGDTKAIGESGTDSKASNLEGMAETNVFARLGKSTKRKEDPSTANPDPELAAEDEETPEADAPRQPPKRPLIRSRGPPAGGLFGRALSGLRKDVTPPAPREARTTQQQTPDLEKTEKEDVQSQGDRPSATQPAVLPLMRDVLQKDEESGPAEAPKTLLKTTTPMRRGVRRESSEGGISPTDCTILQCRNLRPAFNKKDVLERHFSRFGKVSKILCRPAKNLAIVYFEDHASAAKAKKKGKMMHKQELLLLWQRKKHSPGDKGSTPAADQEEGEIVEDTEAHSSPLRRPQLRAPGVSSMVNFSRSSPVKRSSIAKSLQFDSDQKESVSEAQSSERTVPSSLLHLIGQVAETAEDKYRLLEQRDKILRQGRPKRQELDLSKVFVGTCSDMCPEKERYMRETRKQLSTFEVIPNTEMVDHTTAIKEYSRSSADQEEPLPHELRPLPVLSMTMDYLVTQIMDQGVDNYRDWYDFVWNRTRGIRKDITQQRLCCPHTVSLIEKCTRFHVHCAHHLCEEQMSAFDPKINNENMTKCLQSLKEMYEDLKSRGIYCPHEAEFRQYSVLLRLNDGDILREVQQFRDEVRNSPEVKFAVQAFAALNSNNFVRFFKLVKGASYLASCLLHRYFNQVRAKALKTLIMAHTVGPRSTSFPAEDIVRMLMFHNAEEAADVIQQYGVNVNDGLVELSRVAYQEPELPLSHKKSDIILAKKTMLIGEVVNGSTLPAPSHHTPVCSFDSQNKYRGEGPLAEPTSSQFKDMAVKVEVKPPMPSVGLLPQVAPAKPEDVPTPSLFSLPPAAETGEPDEPYRGMAAPSDGQPLFQPIFQPEPVKPATPPPKPPPAYSDEDITAEADSVIDEFLNAAVMEVASAGATYATMALSESSVQVDSLVSEVLGQLLQEISSDEFQLEQQRVAEEKRKLEEARRKQEHEAFLVEFSFSLCKEVIHEVLDETIKETATAEIQQALDDKAQCVAKCTEQVCTGLVEETLNADISLLVEEILNGELQRIRKYIQRWRDVVAVRRQLKRQMRGFPASPCCVDPRFKLKALAPSAPAQASLEDLARGVVNLGNAGTLALSSTRVLKTRRDAMHQMKVHYYYQQLLDKMVWSPLDLPALVMESLDNPPDRIFWKAVLLLPSDDESVASPADRILSDWLEVKLGGGKESKVTEEKLDGALQTLCVSNTLQENGERAHKVHLSVKMSRGPLSEDGLFKMEECYDLQGTGALVLLLPALPISNPKHDEPDVPLLSALLQLKQLQQASTWHCPLPLVVLVPGPDSGDSQKLEEALMLHKLVQEGLISEYTFVFIPETTSDPVGSKQLNHAMRWLVARAPPCFPLSCQTLVQLIEAALSHEFSPRVHAHRQERSSARLPPQEPGPVVRLYNAVLAHVADRVSSQELCRLSWPPGEFCLQDNREFVPHLGWNSPGHLAWLRTAILSLQLPECTDISATDSWSDRCAAIFRYASQIPATHCSQPLLISRLENLLERVRVGHPPGAPVSTAASGRGKRGAPAHGEIPWDDVVVMCIDHKLKDWQIPGLPACEDAVTEDGEILVYLPKDAVKSFEPPKEWTEAVRQTHRDKQEENTGACAAACLTPTGPAPRQRLFQSFVGPAEAPAAPLDISHTPTTEEQLTHKFLQNLEEEKAESKRSMEQLQRWLDGDTLENWSTSLFLPSSTLLSMPATITRMPAAKARHPTEDPEPDELLDKANWKKTSPVSTTKRLKDLELQILASQEEELACRLKLSGMLSIVDD